MGFLVVIELKAPLPPTRSLEGAVESDGIGVKGGEALALIGVAKSVEVGRVDVGGQAAAKAAQLVGAKAVGWPSASVISGMSWSRGYFFSALLGGLP